MTNLPTGNYTSTVTGRPAISGGMTIGGTNDAPTVTYRNFSATNVSWNADTATITFSFTATSRWTFSGTYSNGTFSGSADNGQSPEAERDAWEARAQNEETASTGAGGE